MHGMRRQGWLRAFSALSVLLGHLSRLLHRRTRPLGISVAFFAGPLSATSPSFACLLLRVGLILLCGIRQNLSRERGLRASF
jgi:hypothetical protein